MKYSKLINKRYFKTFFKKFYFHSHIYLNKKAKKGHKTNLTASLTQISFIFENTFGVIYRVLR